MLLLLDKKERRMLNQICNEPGTGNRPCDSDVSLRLERKGLAYRSILGQCRPTPAGRLMAESMTVVTIRHAGTRGER